MLTETVEEADSELLAEEEELLWEEALSEVRPEEDTVLLLLPLPEPQELEEALLLWEGDCVEVEEGLPEPELPREVLFLAEALLL